MKYNFSSFSLPYILEEITKSRKLIDTGEATINRNKELRNQLGAPEDSTVNNYRVLIGQRKEILEALNKELVKRQMMN
jgi:hypothetical protein